MKKLLFSMVAVLFATLTIVSCGSKSDPKGVAKSYLDALKKMDYENAKKFGTPETGKMLDMISSFSSMMPDSIKNKAKDIKIDIKGEPTIEGDKATVKFTSSDKPDAEETLNLVKKDGKWLVNMTKDDMGGGAAGAGATPTEEAATSPSEETVPVAADSAKAK